MKVIKVRALRSFNGGQDVLPAIANLDIEDSRLIRATVDVRISTGSCSGSSSRFISSFNYGIKDKSCMSPKPDFDKIPAKCWARNEFREPWIAVEILTFISAKYWKELAEPEGRRKVLTALVKIWLLQ
ncbi:hypothetical protein Glove_564g49 [Diversispora epigaea]|uniref:Uncharacterized protein n=1 Tax=Diversispora epigaea TaxID=1348612 RepID=A0A397GAI4_9GLOM|nr:hypothetical protein Glove_564g49 [Diversispora epigaea]